MRASAQHGLFPDTHRILQLFGEPYVVKLLKRQGVADDVAERTVREMTLREIERIAAISRRVSGGTG